MGIPADLYQKLIELPENVVGQIVDHELIVSPRPTAEHQLAAGAIHGQLWSVVQQGGGGKGGWWLLPEPELHLGEDVLVPDLAGWRSERLAGPPSGPALELAPDWVCEVLSPSTARLDRGRKLSLYGAAGVLYQWIVDPAAQTLECFRRSGESWIFVGAWGGGERVRVEPFETVELQLSTLWPA